MVTAFAVVHGAMIFHEQVSEFTTKERGHASTGERTRLACRRWRLAIANFSARLRHAKREACFGEAPKPARRVRSP